MKCEESMTMKTTATGLSPSRPSACAAASMLRALLCCLVLTLLPVAAAGQTFERLSPYEEQLYGSRIFVSGDYDAMRHIRNYWQRESVRLRSLRGCEFSLCGNGDAVLRVTIPARLLYAPNDTLLMPTADAQLRPFLPWLRSSSPLATVLIACHSDANGSPAWLTATTEARARSVGQWFRRQGVPAAGIVTYGCADHSPRAGGESISARERNRRLTLYFVPAKEMLKLARKDKLK